MLSLLGCSKSTFARNFQFLTPSPSCSSLFVLHVTPPPSTYVCFGELPPFSKKFRDVHEFLNEKSGGEKREKNYFFCKLNIKDQCFLHSYIYNNNKNIYRFIKKRLHVSFDSQRKKWQVFLVLWIVLYGFTVIACSFFRTTFVPNAPICSQSTLSLPPENRVEKGW